MSDTETCTLAIPLEVREADGGPRFKGVILQEGRAGVQRAELFAPGSVIWPSSGISIRTAHRGAEVARAVPARHPDGAISIDTKATPEIREAFNAGKRYLSIEFHALREVRTRANVREIQRALCEAAAMTDDPEYVQATAEVRERRRRRAWR